MNTSSLRLVTVPKDFVEVKGKAPSLLLFYAYLNACFQTGFTNPMDAAIPDYRAIDLAGWEPLDEIPYDFVRKRLSVLASNGPRTCLVTKGAVEAVLQVCTTARARTEATIAIAEAAERIREQYAALSAQGLRTLGLAVREMAGATAIRRDDECDMTFLSANFGNMFSMAGASVFLPFLPLLPKQILLTNLLTDLPELTISNGSSERLPC